MGLQTCSCQLVLLYSNLIYENIFLQDEILCKTKWWSITTVFLPGRSNPYGSTHFEELFHCIFILWSFTFACVHCRFVPATFMLWRYYMICPPCEGRLGMSDVLPLSGISGLSFDSTLLSPILFFCLVLLIFLSYLFFSACWSILLNFFQKILQYFSLRWTFLCGSCFAAWRSTLVSGMCNMLPSDTGIYCYACM